MAKTYVGQLYKNKVNVVAPKSVDMSEYANGRIPSYLSYQNNNVVNVTDILKNFPLPTWYTQYADQNGNFIAYEEPNQWYNKIYGVTSTWELMFNTESVYFRTEGSLASSGRSNGIQGDAGRGFSGYIRGARMSSGVYGGILSQSRNGGSAQFQVSGTVGSYDIELNSNYPNANEFRTTNRLIRVYHLLSVNGKPVSEIVTGA